MSVVLSLGGEPLLVDPGTATYVMDDELRARMRSARMHNTVILDGREHAVPHGPFHWANRTDARVLAAATGPEMDYAVGTHDGYLPARHLRAVVAIHGVGWVIVDRITGNDIVHADAWWHFHPSWQVELAGGSLRLRHPTGRRTGMALTGGAVEIERDQAWRAYAPAYGLVEYGVTARVHARRATPFVMAAFVPAADGSERVAIVALAEQRDSNWVRCPFQIDDGAREWRVEVCFPSDLNTEPSNWPQPCIEQLVQSCVE